MSALDSTSAVVDPPPDHAADVGVFPTIAEGEEHGLVVLAAGHPYWLLPSDSGFRLVVEAAAASHVRRHLAAYARERLHWPPHPLTDFGALPGFSLITPLAWGALILGVHLYFPAWRDRAALDGAALFERREIWRPFTALFFHASAEHVLSNLLGGLFVLTAAVATFGRLRTWLLVFLAASAANLVIAALRHPQPYHSLGASTAVFATLGLLTGRAVRLVATIAGPRRPLRPFFVPIAASLTVFALHSPAGPQVDVGAHLAGFAAGLIAGFFFGLSRASRASAPA